MGALCWLLAALWWAVLVRVLVARRGLPTLSASGPLPGRLPTLSVILAASNEAHTLPEALDALLAQDYPGLQVVAVDDRSTDGTGALLQERATRDSRLLALQVRELPEGWLGKTHALHVGGSAATGELLLFTDADVVFAPGGLSRAVSWFQERGADHLALAPTVEARGFWEQVLVSLFGVGFTLRFPPDRAARPGDPVAIGVGAFNLVRAQVWRDLGGHRPLAMQVIDDMVLAALVKRSGRRSLFAEATGLLRVRWVVGLLGVVRGLEKNAYAGLAYSPVETAVAVGALLVGTLGPAAGAFLGYPGGLVAWAGMAACSFAGSPTLGLSPWTGLAWPVAGPVMAWTLVRSAWLAETRGAIVWRGTRYPLHRLRAERIPV